MSPLKKSRELIINHSTDKMRRPVSRELVAVIAIMGLGTLAMSILNPILPLYLTSLGVTPEILGLMLSTAMVGMVFGESTWGWVADKAGLKIPLSIGTFISGLVVLFFALMQNISAIFLIFFFWGIVRSALFGPGRGYIGSNAPPLRKATFMAITVTMLSISRSLGALPSGFIVDTWGYQPVFFVSCGIGLLGGTAVITGLRKIQPVEPEPPAVPPSPTNETPAKGQGLPYRSFSFQCLVTALQFWGVGVSIAFLPLLATEVIGVRATEVGILFTIGGLVTVILGIPMGILADRKGKKGVMILGLLVSASGLAGIALAQSFSWLILAVITLNLGTVMFTPAALGLLSDSVPPERQSTAMGLYGGICENTGIIAGSALGGFIWSAWGPQATFLTGTVAALLGAVICSSMVKSKGSKSP
ncbi:MAG: MFS transporter [Chloroflexi bacterium]|nr:MFS transporter [Chloroflexota bacterium]